MKAINVINKYSVQLDGGGKTARLFFSISTADGQQAWHCNRKDFLGAPNGQVKWKGRALGMFVGDTPLAVLEIPSDGLDTVPTGQGSSAWFAGIGEGTWSMIKVGSYEGS